MTHRGFTMIEMLLATALCALLLIGVIQVIATLSTKVTVVRASTPDTDGVWQVISDDLSQARSLRSTEDRVVIHGFSPAAADQPHRPVRVEYLIRSKRDRNWLIRRMVRLDELTNEHVETTLVAPDCKSIRILPAPPPEQGEGGSVVNEPVRSEVLPSCVVVTVERSTGTQTKFMFTQ